MRKVCHCYGFADGASDALEKVNIGLGKGYSIEED